MIINSTPWSISVAAEGRTFVAKGEWTLEPKFYVDHFEMDGVHVTSLTEFEKLKELLWEQAGEKGWDVEFPSEGRKSQTTGMNPV